MQMPGMNGKLVEGGGWATGQMQVGNKSFAEQIEVNNRTQNQPRQYVAGISVQFVAGFESGTADEWEAFIANAGNANTTNNNNGDGTYKGYRYGFNGQEKSNEIFEGSTTALFWEYDSRIGRRWNVDPITNTSESPYVCFSNNPLLYNDPLGDFRNWFGAKWHSIWHGGGSVGKNKYGEWYVSKAKVVEINGNNTSVKFERFYGKGRHALSSAGEKALEQAKSKAFDDEMVRLGAFERHTTIQEANEATFKNSVGVLLPNFLKGSSGLFSKADKVSKEINEAAKTSRVWEVGAYNELQGVEAGLQAHHVGQKSLMGKLVPGYNPANAPSILVPEIGHVTNMPGIGRVAATRGLGGFTNARQVLARDIFELRRVYGSQGIPNSSLQQLIQMNKTMYPGAFIK